MEERTASLRHRIPNEKRQECLRLFEQGYGYKKTAQLAGLNAYTVREYKRKYAAGDVSISASMQRETTPGHIEAVYPSETVGW